jgi:excisionase family DNA binding protein
MGRSRAQEVLDRAMPASDLTRLLSADEVAGFLGVSARYVRQLARLPLEDPDRLSCVRLGDRVLFRPADVQRYVEERVS